MRTKNAISEERDTLGRNRYIEKQRSAQTIKIIGSPNKLNTIYREMLSETTHEVITDMERYEGMYFGSVIQYIGRYLWKIVDFLPEKHKQIWDMYQGRPPEYFTSIRIRDAAIIVGNELKRNFLIGAQERTNWASIDYVRRLQLMGDEKGK